MKAAVYYNYGPPWAISLKDIVKPISKNTEELIKVYAGTFKRTDSSFRSAKYFISRFWTRLFKPKSNMLGNEFAEIVEEIGQNVTTFKKGDKVFGCNDRTCGGHGEYLTIA
jgi:NADPH:quinone reductase-like Zn-dependent oxidoreductase